MRKLVISIVVLFFLISISTTAFAQDTERIDVYNTKIQINDNGTMDVEEDIVYSFGNVQKHGIYRDINIIKENTEGKRFKLTISNIQVDNHPYTVSKTRDNVRIKIGDPDKYVTGVVNYKIKYIVSGAITYFEQFDELYWNVIGTDWNVPIMDASALISIPGGFKNNNEASCYTGASGANESSCTSEMKNDSILFQTKRRLNAHEAFTTAVKFPKDLVAYLPAQPDRSALLIKILLILLGVILFIWNLIFPIFIFLRWYKDYKNTKENQKLLAAWFNPPKNNDGSNFTPGETSAIVTKSAGHSAITGSLIYLAQKGYFKIIAENNKAVKFQRNLKKNMDVGLTKAESSILKAIFPTDNKTETTVKELGKSEKFFRATQDYENETLNKLYEINVFEDNPKRIRNVYTIIFGISLVIFAPILAVVSLLLGRKSYRKTLKGIQKYSEAVSLKRFLTAIEEQLNFQSKNQMFFEKLLPYATAFGVEDIWAKRFSDMKFTQSDWYEGNLANAAAYSALSSSLNRSVVSGISSGRAGSSSRGFSSGSSGGGSAGGGGGGGGGGSW